MDHTPLKNTEPGEVSQLLKQIEPGPQRPPPRVPQDGFWHHYVAPWKKYAVFGGRARRKEYWTFQLVNLVPTVGLMAGTLGADPTIRTVSSILLLLFALAAALPGLAVGVRRLQDTGRHGAYIALAFIPFLGPLVLFVLFLLPSTSGSNAYGADPTTACHDEARP